jgi:hypothetical protein
MDGSSWLQVFILARFLVANGNICGLPAECFCWDIILLNASFGVKSAGLRSFKGSISMSLFIVLLVAAVRPHSEYIASA